MRRGKMGGKRRVQGDLWVGGHIAIDEMLRRTEAYRIRDLAIDTAKNLKLKGAAALVAVDFPIVYYVSP